MPRTRFVFIPIAETGDRFSDFAPYVASINNAGLVAFQAALSSGGTGVFTGSGGSISAVIDTSSHPFTRFRSHPDINRNGDTCVYADLEPGLQAVLLVRDGRPITVAETGVPLRPDRPGAGPARSIISESSRRMGRTSSSQPFPVTATPANPGSFATIGPLGPTMNETGTVAFRADLKSGENGIFIGDGTSITAIADSSGIFSAFQGLPVINGNGTVLFLADLKGGGQGLYTWSGGSLTRIVGTRSLSPDNDRHFSAFASFPSINDAGFVAFGATDAAGGAGVFTATASIVTTLVQPTGPFESVRNALINNAGTVIFAATPRGGQLGIFSGPDPITDRILALGDPLFGSTVASFALNPVSVNDVGQVALRVALANERQLILRADPTS